MRFFRANRSIIFAVCCLIFHTACSDKAGLPLSDAFERPVDFQQTLQSNQSNSPDESLNDPLSNDPLSNDPVYIDVNFPDATWSTPVNIFDVTLPTNVNNEIFGPRLSVSDSVLNPQSNYVSIHQNSLLDSSSGGFINQQALSFGFVAAEEAWTSDLPYAPEFADATANMQIKLNDVIGGAYAIWTRDGSLYINQKDSTDVWQQEVLIWQHEGGVLDLRTMDLLVDMNGDAWVVWVNGFDANINQFISVDAPGGGGLQPTQTVIINNALVFSKPVISNSGVISLSWVNIPEGIFEPNLLQLVQYNPANAATGGWSVIETAQPLNTANSMSAHLSMIVAIDEILMIISQDSFGRIFAVRFDPATTTKWSDWENVDYNIGRNEIIAHDAKLASNHNDSVMAIWSEQKSSGANTTYIYASLFSPIGDANGVHWPVPQLVGTTSIRIDPNEIDQVNFKTFPLIEMMTDGRAIASWLDTDSQNSSLYTNLFTPGTGWASVPDQIISYALYTEGVIRSADLAITPTGNVFISWQQLTKTEFAKQYKFWVSDTLL